MQKHWFLNKEKIASTKRSVIADKVTLITAPCGHTCTLSTIIDVHMDTLVNNPNVLTHNTIHTHQRGGRKCDAKVQTTTA